MKALDQTVVKSLLAKILAAEDLTVVHENAQTASFDVEKRVLHLPNWVSDEGISNDLYTMLVGHEVGHALYTPEKGWHDAIFKCDKTHEHTEACFDANFKGFLNVCEDARQEKKLKRKFPGLRRQFISAGKELLDRDFFGIKGLTDLNELALIDRINLATKVGTHLKVDFTDVEQSYVDRLNEANTFEEVEQVAREIYTYSKDNEKQKINSIDQLLSKTGQGQRGKEQPEKLSGKLSTEKDPRGAKKGKPSTVVDGREGSGSGSENTTPMAITDKIYRDREASLTSPTSIRTEMLPQINAKACIMPLAEVLSTFERSQASSYKEQTFALYKKEQHAMRDQINTLVKAFEMKKAATTYHRALQHHTGELDMRVLSQYKFTSDIFRRAVELPKGKNHGMVMFLDMSGSMSGDYMVGAIKQILCVTTFCSKVGIPFEIYGFTDTHCTKYENAFNAQRNYASFFIEGDNSFHLLTLATSSVKGEMYRRSMMMLVALAAFNQGRGRYNPSCLSLGGTPLIETILSSRSIIEKFQQNSKVEIVNVLYLTDGAGNRPRISEMHTNQLLLQDKKTHEQILIKTEDQVQSALTRLVQQVTGCRHLGFYICDGQEIKQWAEMKTDVTDPPYAVVKKLGFDNYYLINHNIMMGREAFTPLDAHNGDVSTQLMDRAKQKKDSRVVLEMFIDDIATQMAYDSKATTLEY